MHLEREKAGEQLWDAEGGEKGIILRNCKLKKKHELSVLPDSFHISEDLILRFVKQTEVR